MSNSICNHGRSKCCGSGSNPLTYCSGFTFNVIHYSGVDPSFPMNLTGDQANYANQSSRWKNVTTEVGGNTSKLKGGDLLINPGHHTKLIIERNGRLSTAEANVCYPGVDSGYEPQLHSGVGSLNGYQIFRIQ